MFTLTSLSDRRKHYAYQKLCPQCHLAMHSEVSQCLACGHSPWTWRPNLRLLVVTLLLAVVGLVLFRPLTVKEESYRVPMMAPTPEDRE